MATILKPLGNEYYSVGKGAVFFFPVGDTIGYRLGDPESLSFSIDETEEAIFSNEHDIKTQVGTLTSEQTVTFTLRIKQLSNIVRAASIKGKMGTISQEAAPEQVRTFSEPGVYDLAALGITIVDATIDGTPAIMGLPENGGDYTVDTRSGLIEIYTSEQITVTYNVPAISTRFASGIASGNGLVGKLVFVGTNRQGVRSKVVAHNVSLKPSGGREFVSDGEIQVTELTGVATPVSGFDPEFAIGYEQDLPALGEAA